MRTFAVALLVALVLAGCSDDDDAESGDVQGGATATPSGPAESPSVAPPSAYLADSSGAAREGGTGTYCWRSADVQMCRDYFGPRTNVSPIEVATGARLHFTFDAGDPAEVKADWTPAAEMASSQAGEVLEWGPRDAAAYAGPSYTDPLTAPTEPGGYVLAVFARFAEGDVTYGFYVEVR